MQQRITLLNWCANKLSKRLEILRGKYLFDKFFQNGSILLNSSIEKLEERIINFENSIVTDYAN